MEAPIFKTSLFAFVIFFIPLVFCFGGDERNLPAEVFIIIDNSISMKESKDEAITWINEHVLTNILQPGDTLTIWSVADTSVMEFSGTIGSADKINEIKNILTSLKPKDTPGNYRTAFEEIQKKAASRQGLTYTILVTGISDKTTSLSGTTAANFLKYSRSEDFPGWKVMIIGLGLQPKVKSAAAAYISSQL